MTDEQIKAYIRQAAEESAARAVEKLRESGRINRVFPKTFKKTEELLYLYPKLSEDNPERQRVDEALTKIQGFDYCDIVASKYFDGLTLEEISDIYDCAYQTTCNRRNKLVNILARQLFPEDVLAELLEK